MSTTGRGGRAYLNDVSVTAAVVEDLHLPEDPRPAQTGLLVDHFDCVLLFRGQVATGEHRGIGPFAQDLSCHFVDVAEVAGGQAQAGALLGLPPPAGLLLLFGQRNGDTVGRVIGVQFLSKFKSGAVSLPLPAEDSATDVVFDFPFTLPAIECLETRIVCKQMTDKLVLAPIRPLFALTRYDTSTFIADSTVGGEDNSIRNKYRSKSSAKKNGKKAKTRQAMRSDLPMPRNRREKTSTQKS